MKGISGIKKEYPGYNGDSGLKGNIRGIRGFRVKREYPGYKGIPG